MIGVPEYVEPENVNDPNGLWSPEEEGLLIVNKDVAANLSWDGRKAVVQSTAQSKRGFWETVHFCREYEIPGCWKVSIEWDGNMYRLGALYIIAGFELTERETDYIKYGESPYVK